MLTKTALDEIQNFFVDASNLPGGAANNVFFPENARQISEILRDATAMKTPITISGAGTGTVGGRVPFGGAALSKPEFCSAITKKRPMPQIYFIRLIRPNGRRKWAEQS